MGQHPPSYPQAPWPQQSVPPQRGNNVKWLLVAIAVLLVIGVTIGATLLFTRGAGDASPTPSTSASPGDIASANDTGPVSIITEEPTCMTFNGINNSLADVEANGWGTQRATLGPASEWTAEQRRQTEAVAAAMRNAADQVVTLAKQTPHRVVREIYQQFIAYGRAYADSLPSYVPADDGLASAFVSAGSALIGICNTIEYGSASRSIGIASAPSPTQVVPPTDLSNPIPFIASSNPACAAWVQRLDGFNSTTSSDWQNRDAGVPASEWTPERRAVELAARPLLMEYANDITEAGRQSDNPVFQDFAFAAALYTKAYLAAGDNYNGAADGWLNYTAFRLANLVSGACRAVAG
ncbi:hypothetical protein [Mycobacterium sp. URHB0044]|jgi:hypothetical protein|uniref:hypothetical protein n=1 Tax=Mycobacterium sp. URHB0044 TaxID=1380386 RepID=UPI0012DBCF4F|nr:hypothetical protein [Mycobacterium sp. URHB0044]